MIPQELVRATELAEAGQDVSESLMYSAMKSVLDEATPPELIARFLTALARKGEVASEITGAARALREMMVPLKTSRKELLDIVGTGGDRSGSFNISTAAAIVAAAAGAPVAKHGNRSVTSRSGSADVLRELGINLDAPLSVVEACLEHLGICFCFAPRFHPAMRRVAPIRQELGFPTIFNILGPLLNPAGACYQLLGVSRADLRPKLAEALQHLGTRRSWVIHNSEGLDELGLEGLTFVTETEAGGFREFVINPREFPFPSVNRQEVIVADARESAQMIRDILAGRQIPGRYFVCLNAAAALVVAGLAQSLEEGIDLSMRAIDSGRAQRLLATWIQCSWAEEPDRVRELAMGLAK
jgi:anthranilate phosphoribosyltransferase